jgi:hypothetical protein
MARAAPAAAVRRKKARRLIEGVFRAGAIAEFLNITNLDEGHGHSAIPENRFQEKISTKEA